MRRRGGLRVGSLRRTSRNSHVALGGSCRQTDRHTRGHKECHVCVSGALSPFAHLQGSSDVDDEVCRPNAPTHIVPHVSDHSSPITSAITVSTVVEVGQHHHPRLGLVGRHVVCAVMTAAAVVAVVERRAGDRWRGCVVVCGHRWVRVDGCEGGREGQQRH